MPGNVLTLLNFVAVSLTLLSVRHVKAYIHKNQNDLVGWVEIHLANFIWIGKFAWY